MEGRTKKQAEYWEQMRSWVEQNGIYPQRGGATITLFCQHFAIDIETYRNWIENPNSSEFSEMVKNANKVFEQHFLNDLVDAVHKKALGYEDWEETVEGKPDADGNMKTQKIIRRKRTVAPDMGAASFLLCNLAPDRWKNPLKVEAMVQGSIDVTAMTPEEARRKLEDIENIEVRKVE